MRIKLFKLILRVIRVSTINILDLDNTSNIGHGYPKNIIDVSESATDIRYNLFFKI